MAEALTSPEVVLESPLPGGLRIGLVFAGDALAELDFLPADRPLVSPGQVTRRDAAQWLECWFEDPRTPCTLRLEPRGTPFQHRVWGALVEIPAGQTRTYGALARELGTSARAVGNACRANPLPIVIPCHRVVSAAGAGGYMGETGGDPMTIKRWLLAHERAYRH